MPRWNFIFALRGKTPAHVRVDAGEPYLLHLAIVVVVRLSPKCRNEVRPRLVDRQGMVGIVDNATELGIVKPGCANYFQTFYRNPQGPDRIEDPEEFDAHIGHAQFFERGLVRRIPVFWWRTVVFPRERKFCLLQCFFLSKPLAATNPAKLLAVKAPRENPTM